jgi:hypothetical protein
MSFAMRMKSAQRASAEALSGGTSVMTCAQADNAKANINTPVDFIISSLCARGSILQFGARLGGMLPCRLFCSPILTA